MIIMKVCRCSLAHDAAQWTRLLPLAVVEVAAVAQVRRRCLCGLPLEVSKLEDDTARLVSDNDFKAEMHFGLARLALAAERAGRVMKMPTIVDRIHAHRRAAKVFRSQARLSEALLMSLYRQREWLSPRARVGRNIVAVDRDVDEEAPTLRGEAVPR